MQMEIFFRVNGNLMEELLKRKNGERKLKKWKSRKELCVRKKNKTLSPKQIKRKWKVVSEGHSNDMEWHCHNATHPHIEQFGRVFLFRATIKRNQSHIYGVMRWILHGNVPRFSCSNDSIKDSAITTIERPQNVEQTCESERQHT